MRFEDYDKAIIDDCDLGATIFLQRVDQRGRYGIRIHHPVHGPDPELKSEAEAVAIAEREKSLGYTIVTSSNLITVSDEPEM